MDFNYFQLRKLLLAVAAAIIFANKLAAFFVFLATIRPDD
jgi:hypothetical protein